MFRDPGHLFFIVIELVVQPICSRLFKNLRKTVLRSWAGHVQTRANRQSVESRATSGDRDVVRSLLTKCGIENVRLDLRNMLFRYEVITYDCW